MLDCLPELAFDYIINLLIAGNGPFFREFFALAASWRRVRARCIEVAQRALDPSGTWDSLTGPREADIVSHRADGCTPLAWRQRGKVRADRWIDVQSVFSSTTLRIHLLLQSMTANVEYLNGTVLDGLIMCAPRDIFDRVNAAVNLSKFFTSETTTIAIATRRLPLDIINPNFISEYLLRGVIDADLRNGDHILTYARACMKKGIHRGESIMTPSILLDETLPTRDIVLAFAEFGEISWVSITNYVALHPETICKLRELFEYIPHSRYDVTNYVFYLVLPLFARGIVAHEPWMRGVRILLRYFRRCEESMNEYFDTRIIAQIAREFIEHDRDWPNASGMRAIFNDIGIVTKNDAEFWCKVEADLVRYTNPRVTEFIVRMKHACFKPRE